MDDVFGLGASFEHALRLVRQPVEKLFGPAWNEVGGALGDRVRHWRDMRRLELAMRAVERLRVKGVDPKTVDPSILFPLLDAGSVATDPSLQEKWVALLATAADPTSEIAMSPAFAEILKQLTPIEAQIIDWMSSNGEPSAHEPTESFVVCVSELSQIQERFGLSRYNAEVIASNLFRLGLIESGFQATGGIAPSRSYGRVSLTPIAILFVAACRSEPTPTA
jgi:hypothetical protein